DFQLRSLIIPLDIYFRKVRAHSHAAYGKSDPRHTQHAGRDQDNFGKFSHTLSRPFLPLLRSLLQKSVNPLSAHGIARLINHTRNTSPTSPAAAMIQPIPADRIPIAGTAAQTPIPAISTVIPATTRATTTAPPAKTIINGSRTIITRIPRAAPAP